MQRPGRGNYSQSVFLTLGTYRAVQYFPARGEHYSGTEEYTSRVYAGPLYTHESFGWWSCYGTALSANKVDTLDVSAMLHIVGYLLRKLYTVLGPPGSPTYAKIKAFVTLCAELEG